MTRFPFKTEFLSFFSLNSDKFFQDQYPEWKYWLSTYTTHTVTDSLKLRLVCIQTSTLFIYLFFRCVRYFVFLDLITTKHQTSMFQLNLSKKYSSLLYLSPEESLPNVSNARFYVCQYIYRGCKISHGHVILTGYLYEMVTVKEVSTTGVPFYFYEWILLCSVVNSSKIPGWPQLLNGWLIRLVCIREYFVGPS